MASNPISKLTEQEYLAIERAAEFRSEFIDGEMFPRPIVVIRHVLIQSNLLVQLVLALKNSPSEPLGSQSRLRVSSNAYVYPDVSIIPDGHTLDQDADIIENPVAVFEVMSPSTEAFDRGTRSELYRSIGLPQRLRAGEPG
ncbi:MAG: Uma2 family endonuclease [Bryobacteraceae bacterium]